MVKVANSGDWKVEPLDDAPPESPTTHPADPPLELTPRQP
jgi:hypothetical protein